MQVRFIVVGFYACNPRLMSVGGCLLSFPRWVLLLFHFDAIGVGPIHVSPKPVAPCSFALVLGFFVDAGHAVVFDSNWMKTMRAAVRSHVPEFLKLAPLAAFVCSAVGVDILAIRVRVRVRVRVAIELVGHAGNGGGELLNLRLHRCQLIRCLNVGCRVGGIIGCTCAGELLDVLADLVTVVCHLIG